MVCKKIIFEGKVQKIGFRYFVFEQAKKASVVGYVRNLDNGCVELVAQGDYSAIELFLENCLKKHPMAVIENFTVENLELQKFDDFQVRR